VCLSMRPIVHRFVRIGIPVLPDRRSLPEEQRMWSLGTARKGSATPPRTTHPPVATQDGGHRLRRSRIACAQLLHVPFGIPATTRPATEVAATAAKSAFAD